jgi:regulator of replication initiation timing
VTGPADSVVQDLLADRRRLMVENERLKLEADEARSRFGKPDPKLERLEAENRRLREELRSARAERDELQAGVRSAVDQLRRAVT